MTILAAVVVAGAVGVFGVHSATKTANSNGYQLTVTYPTTARAGLDVPWRVLVRHPGGFSGDLTIAVSSDYFRMFETQGFFPEADSETSDGNFIYFKFDKPDGDEFVFDYDTYVQPASQLGKSATVKILIGDDEVASTKIHTWLTP